MFVSAETKCKLLKNRKIIQLENWNYDEIV